MGTKNPLDVADSDSQGLADAYSLLITNDSKRELIHGNMVYLYRYVLHEAFAEWKLPVLDAFCRQFPGESLIVTQPNTIWLSEAEFSTLGFGPIEDVLCDRLPQIKHPAPRLIVRDLTLAVPLSIDDYPTDFPPASEEHQKWVDEALPAHSFFC